jgi:hypothetical protein
MGGDNLTDSINRCILKDRRLYMPKVTKLEPVVGVAEAYIKQHGYRINEGPNDPRDSVDDYLDRTKYLTNSAKEVPTPK